MWYNCHCTTATAFLVHEKVIVGIQAIFVKYWSEVVHAILNRFIIFSANKMQLSFQQGKAASLPTAHSVASGLSPPFAGELCYKICKQYVDEIVTVNDQQLAIASRTLYRKGLVVEPAGAASFAALIFNKIPNLYGNVVAVVTGGNATPLELDKLFDSIKE